jgi:hypothetical protein
MEKQAEITANNISSFLGFHGIDLTEEQIFYIKTEIAMVLLQSNIEKMQFELQEIKKLN